MSKAANQKPQPSANKSAEAPEHYAYGLTKTAEGLWCAYKYTIKNQRIIFTEELYMPSHEQSVAQDQLEVAIERAWPTWK